MDCATISGNVPVRADQGADLVDAASDLSHRAVFDLTVLSFESLLELFNDDVGMGVADGKDKRLAGQIGIDVPGQLLGDCPVKRHRDHLPIETLNIERYLIWRMGEIDLAGAGIQDFQLLAGLNLIPA
jgi:hypothetical protein